MKRGITVFRRYGIAVGLAAMCAATAAAQQQPPASGSTPQQPAAQTQPADRSTGTTATLIGCVYKEQDVAGRTPNVAERAGVMEDYILAQVERKGDATASGAVGTSGAAGHRMYKLEQIADERLKALVGKRVEVTGKIDAGDTARPSGAPAADKNPASPDKIELPEFEVSSIKEVEGTCPANPSAK
jgi:hypothetical protein